MTVEAVHGVRVPCWVVCALAVLPLMVDKFHFKTHSTKDGLCQHLSNPDRYPAPITGINTQSAEQYWSELNKRMRSLNYMSDGMFRFWILTFCVWGVGDLWG